MPIKTAPKIRIPEDLFQRDAKVALESLGRVDILQGAHLTEIDLTTGTTQVAHTLGRIPKGFIVVDQTANVNVWRDPDKTNQRTTFLYLIASADCTVSLWVY